MGPSVTSAVGNPLDARYQPVRHARIEVTGDLYHNVEHQEAECKGHSAVLTRSLYHSNLFGFKALCLCFR